MKNDTICAISTPLGISGIGIIRISGPDAYRILGRIFRPAKTHRSPKCLPTLFILGILLTAKEIDEFCFSYEKNRIFIPEKIWQR